MFSREAIARFYKALSEANTTTGIALALQDYADMLRSGSIPTYDDVNPQLSAWRESTEAAKRAVLAATENAAREDGIDLVGASLGGVRRSIPAKKTKSPKKKPALKKKPASKTPTPKKPTPKKTTPKKTTPKKPVSRTPTPKKQVSRTPTPKKTAAKKTATKKKTVAKK
jgi:outer membrane biosynthesis protein TonB